MLMEAHTSGLATISRTTEKKMKIRIPRDIFKNGSCDRVSLSQLMTVAPA